VRPRASLAWLGIAALVVSACASRLMPIPLDGRAFTPEGDELVLWGDARREAAALLARVRLYDDPALSSYLRGLSRGPRPDTGAPGGGPDIRFDLVRDPALNAFAMPDGRIIVHTGLLAAMESPAELALILAHEVAHVTHRHTLGAFREGRVRPVSPLDPGVLGPTAGAILGLRLPLAGTASITGYDEAREREADAVALARLRQIGGDAGVAGTLYARLAREARERGALETFLLGRPAWLRQRHASVRSLLTSAAETVAVAASGGLGSQQEFEAHLRPVVRDNAAEDIRQGRFVLARRGLDRVLDADPQDALAHLHYGDLHRLQAQRAGAAAGRLVQAERARARYTRAVALDPALAAAHRQLGLLHYELKEVDQARAEFERYLALAPGAPDAARIAEYVRELER
jgi:beta-barrel assembly-enhancing protease